MLKHYNRANRARVVVRVRRGVRRAEGGSGEPGREGGRAVRQLDNVGGQIALFSFRLCVVGLSLIYVFWRRVL